MSLPRDITNECLLLTRGKHSSGRELVYYSPQVMVRVILFLQMLPRPLTEGGIGEHVSKMPILDDDNPKTLSSISKKYKPTGYRLPVYQYLYCI